MLELTALLAGVTAISGIVEGSLKTLDAIRGRFGGGDNDAKKRLDEQLTELARSLASVGDLGEAADAYLAAVEQVRDLEVDVMLIDQYLGHREQVLRNHLSPEYAPSWGTVEQLLDTFDRDRDLAVRVHLNRKAWFDETDSQMVGSRLNEVNSAFGRLDERVQGRRYADVRQGVDALKEPLRATRVLLHSTLTDQILHGIRQLRTTAGDIGTPADAGPK